MALFISVSLFATYRNLSEDLLWFAGTGIAVLLAGALNLCMAAGLTGPGARAIIAVSVIANLALGALALSFLDPHALDATARRGAFGIL